MRLHHFSWVFEKFCLCPFIFLHFCWDVLQKKTRYIFWSMIDAFGRIFRHVFFLHFSSQMLQKQRGYTMYSPVFEDFCCCMLLSFHFLHFCWDVLQKKRGYTFVGSNDKNYGAFYVLGQTKSFFYHITWVCSGLSKFNQNGAFQLGFCCACAVFCSKFKIAAGIVFFKRALLVILSFRPRHCTASFYTKKLLHRETFTQRSFYTQKLFTQRSFYTHKPFRTTAREIAARKPDLGAKAKTYFEALSKNIKISHFPSIQVLSHCFQVLCLQQGNCTQSCFGFCAPTVWG